MSQHIYQHEDIEVILGYDRPLNYVFCVIERGGAIVYSNLDDTNAGTHRQDVDYYRSHLIRHGITVPEEMFAAVKRDQVNRVGNKVVEYK